MLSAGPSAGNRPRSCWWRDAGPLTMAAVRNMAHCIVVSGVLPLHGPSLSPSPHRSWPRRSTSSCEPSAILRAHAPRENLPRGGCCHSGNDASELACRGAELAPSCRCDKWLVVMAVRPSSWRIAQLRASAIPGRGLLLPHTVESRRIGDRFRRDAVIGLSTRSCGSAS